MTKKERIRAGLQFGIGMMLFNVIYDLFTKDIDSGLAITKMIVSSLVSGVVSGVFFGWLIGPLTKSMLSNVKTTLLLNDKERIIHETPASHYKGVEAVGGKLVLTNERLIFKSHKFNIQNHQLSFLLTEIVKADPYKTLGLINNGLAFTTNDGTIEKFIVSNVEQWLIQLSGYKFLTHENDKSRM
jgi:hypothetical protein